MAKILSIEDDADLQHLFGRVLFREGYDVYYAWNGREGYEKTLEVSPDLVLLDLMLPLMNGVEFLKKLKESKSTQDIPVIIVTAYGDEADMLKYSLEALGAETYLRKPVEIPELLSRVKQVLAQFPRMPQRTTAPEPRKLSKGSVRMDPKGLTVWVNDRLVATLPHKEFALLRCLIESRGEISREKLLRDLGYATRQGDALKQVIHRLREALGEAESRRIKTTPKGYELDG
ncbi:MAG: response regulator transcription factor [Elusimicrobia bacterium]|nr:response regulator transcription factor [Elusimicrobiota bacterium]